MSLKLLATELLGEELLTVRRYSYSHAFDIGQLDFGWRGFLNRGVPGAVGRPMGFIFLLPSVGTTEMLPLTPPFVVLANNSL